MPENSAQKIKDWLHSDSRTWDHNEILKMFDAIIFVVGECVDRDTPESRELLDNVARALGA